MYVIAKYLRSPLSYALLKTAFLVGGFAASTWFYLRLKGILQSDGIELCRPDSHTLVSVSHSRADR